jgi:hypothetical protein
MTDLSIIFKVAAIAFAICGLLAAAVYAVDRSASRHDKTD